MVGANLRHGLDHRWRMGVLVALTLLSGTPCALAQSEGGSIGGSIGGSSGGSIGGNIGESKPAPSAPPNAPVQQAAPAAPAAPVAPAAPATPPRPAVVQRPPPAAPPRRERVERAERREGGTNAYDGTWSIYVQSACAGSGSGYLRIRGGQVFGSNVRGTVSPGGTLRASGRSEGMTQYSSGQLSGSSGGGSFRRVDGCTGTWSASR